MSASANDPDDERRRASLVTFSNISPEVLVVKIRKMSGELKEEHIPKVASSFKPIRKNKSSGDRNARKNPSRSTMTDEKATASSSSQTLSKEQTVPHSKIDKVPEYTPCMKHAAHNLSRKALETQSEKINLCSNCSKSMLSYIFLVQDFLDSLAIEISGNEKSHCLQCARQEVRDNVANLGGNVEGLSHREHSESNTRAAESKKEGVNDRSSKKTTRTRSNRQESKRSENLQNPSSHGSFSPQSQNPQVEFLYNVSPGANQEVKKDTVPYSSGESRLIQGQQSTQSGSSNQQQIHQYQQNNQTMTSDSQSEHFQEAPKYQDESSSHSTDRNYNENVSSPTQSYDQPVAQIPFRSPVGRTQPNYDSVPEYHDQNTPNNQGQRRSPTLFKDDVDGIVSTLSNTEREIYDSARKKAGWEGLTETPEKLGPTPDNLISSEAFVTSCRNNAEAVGCLVVGTSLLLCRTTRTLCVLVSDGVSTAFRGALSAVFQVVQYVRSLDSLGTTKLALLEQPDLGITFEKLNIWRLVQFTKCVYLNPDTLVIQNCDELFSHEELSAVPDIGWPDCFNSGVFVFSPSIQTFWQLLEFSDRQGSYDGGDQGLLNSYFNSWSSDISKKLSFIYNLMANVSYTYTPAFRQFGRNVKIVQFHGSFKPWHVKFFPNSGQVSPSSPVHPTYIQFVHIWLNIFRISVLRLMSQEIQSYATSQETICAVEILRFFPLPSESESDFFLTPPSVRLRLAERKLFRSTSVPLSEARRRKSAEFLRYTDPDGENIPEASASVKEETKDSESVIVPEPVADASDVQKEENLKDSVSDMDEVFQKLGVVEKEKVKDKNALPGAEVGDYQGMKAWEQGRMDYQGSDSSDNVIKRLQFLMSRPT